MILVSIEDNYFSYGTDNSFLPVYFGEEFDINNLLENVVENDVYEVLYPAEFGTFGE